MDSILAIKKLTKGKSQGTCNMYTSPSANKAPYSGFETQRRRHVSVAPHKWLMSFKTLKEEYYKEDKVSFITLDARGRVSTPSSRKQTVPSYRTMETISITAFIGDNSVYRESICSISSRQPGGIVTHSPMCYSLGKTEYYKIYC